MLSVEVHSDGVVGLHELFELLLEAVVLIIQVRHVPVECIDLSLQVQLVLHHLFRMLLQPIQFVTDGLLVLGGLIMCNLELLHSHALFLALHVLMLVGLEQLALRRLVLLILLFEVAELPIQFVQCKFEVLNLLNGILRFMIRARNRVLRLLQHIRNGRNAMVVVFKFCMQHVKSFLLSIDVLVEVE